MNEDTELETFWQKFDAMFQTLTEDVAQLEDQMQSEAAPVWRRALCRAVFAMIEGVNSCLKQYVVTFWPGIIGDDTELALLDQKVVTGKAGDQRVVPSFKPFTENFFFAFDTYAWTSGSFFCPDTQSEDWALLKQANNIRNRVVHPKSLQDLVITDSELALLRRTYKWYIRQLFELFQSTAKALLEESDQFWKAWCESHPELAHPLEPEDEEMKALRRFLESDERPTTKSSVQ